MVARIGELRERVRNVIALVRNDDIALQDHAFQRKPGLHSANSALEKETRLHAGIGEDNSPVHPLRSPPVGADIWRPPLRR